MSFQQLTFVGNLGRDPEMRYTPAGQSVTSFSVACNMTYNQDGERRQETIWFKVSAWGKLAEVCNNFLHKGSKVLITGRIRPDPSTGNPKIFQLSNGGSGASYDVFADKVVFLDNRSEGETENENENDRVPF